MGVKKERKKLEKLQARLEACGLYLKDLISPAFGGQRLAWPGLNELIWPGQIRPSQDRFMLDPD